MAKRLGLGLALSVALVVSGAGCGGGTSGTGKGGNGGQGGHAGSSIGQGGESGSGQLGGTTGELGGNSGETGGNFGQTGGTSGGGTAGGGQGGGAGQGGAAGHPNKDGGADAARDAEATDAHRADASADAGADAHPDSGTTCTNACVLGSHRCAGGGSETCVAGSNGCTQWGSANACLGATTCVTATGVCTCPAAPAGCTAVGTFCNGSGEVVTCAKDAQGCFTGSTPQVCPTDETCHGTLPNAACACDNDPSCTGTNSYCLNPSTVATCGHDGNTPACNVVVSTTGCHGSSACVGGACVCPAVGTTAGTGCATLNATSCAGTDILTCVTESASGCSIWQASTHCGSSGLTCGTKAGAGPACQCPENTGTDVYVDPVGGSDLAAGMFPTGVQGPAACRYGSLTYALTKVGSPGRIIAISATPPVTFSGETFPLAIPSGVSVITADATFNSSNYVIHFFGGGGTAVTLANGSALRGFSIQATDTANALVSCTAGSVTLDTVLLSGGGFAADGLDVSGTCNPTLQSVSSVELTKSALSMTGSGTVSITGGLLSASMVGLLQNNGTVTATGLAVQGNSQYGIRLATGGAGTPALTISGQSVVSNNGSSGAYAGISAAKGNVSVSNTQVSGNGGPGLDLASGGTYTLTNVQVSNNTKSGVSQANGVLTSNGLSAANNGGDGVTINAGSATLTNVALSTNAFDGLNVLAGTPTVDVNGGTIQNNSAAGISAGVGSLTVRGGVDISGNATGVQLIGATASIAGATVRDSTGSGIVVNQPSGLSVTIGAPNTTTTVSSNKQQGILIQSDPAISGSGANSVTIDTVAVTGNGSFGIYLAGTASIAATIKGSKITGNLDTGLMIEQGPGNSTTEAIQNNDISGNNTKPTPRNVGGVLFNTSSTLTSFIGNTVHSNGGDEVGFAAVPNGGTKWVITPPSNACDTTANSIYCYGTGNVGVHVLTGLASVDAQHQHWANNPPTSGIDYSGTATVLNPCSAVPACP